MATKQNPVGKALGLKQCWHIYEQIKGKPFGHRKCQYCGFKKVDKT